MLQRAPPELVVGAEPRAVASTEVERAKIITPRGSNDRLGGGRHLHFEMDPHRESVFDANTISTPSQFSMEPQSALALSDDTLRQHDEERFDYQSRHRNPAYTESWNSGENAERDVEKEAAERENQRQEREEERDPDLVEWDGPDDPENPMNWPNSTKWTVTMALAFMTFCITFASSVFSTATQVTAKEYDVSVEITTLGTSLFVLVGRLLILWICSGVLMDLGVCAWTLSLGTILRAVWPYDPIIHWLRHLRHLPDSRRSCAKSIHHLDLSILWWPVRLCPISHRRRSISRLLGSCRSWYRHLCLLGRDIHRSSRRAHCWWIHHDELSRLAVDCLDYPHHGHSFLHHRAHLRSRNICASAVTTQGEEDSVRNKELGHPC